MSSIAQIASAMQMVLTQEADRLGRETGFIQRQVKWSGSSFVQALVLGFLSNPDASYSELSQSAAALGLTISSQGLEQRFTETAAMFMRQVLEVTVGQVIRTSHSPFPVLDSFCGVYIRDSSVITLVDSLRAVWSGVGSTAGETAALAGARTIRRLYYSTNFLAWQAFFGRMGKFNVRESSVRTLPS